MSNQFNLESELGWLAAVDLASRLGWRDGRASFKKMTGEELRRAMNVTAKLANQTRGHVQELRNIYGAAYYASSRVAERALETN